MEKYLPKVLVNIVNQYKELQNNDPNFIKFKKFLYKKYDVIDYLESIKYYRFNYIARRNFVNKIYLDKENGIVYFGAYKRNSKGDFKNFII